MSSTAVPTAIDICGIHSGVASTPRENLELVRLEGEADAVPREQRHYAAGDRQRAPLEHPSQARRCAFEQQRHADVLAMLEGVGERQKTARRHAR